MVRPNWRRKCTLVHRMKKVVPLLILICVAQLWIVWPRNGHRRNPAKGRLVGRTERDFDPPNQEDSVGHLTATRVVVKDLDSMISNLSTRTTASIDFFEFASIASVSPLKTRDPKTFGYLGFSDRQKVFHNISLSRGRIVENSFSMQLFDFSSGGSAYWRYSPIVVSGVPGCFKYPDVYQITNSKFVKMSQQCIQHMRVVYKTILLVAHRMCIRMPSSLLFTHGHMDSITLSLKHYLGCCWVSHTYSKRTANVHKLHNSCG